MQASDKCVCPCVFFYFLFFVSFFFFLLRLFYDVVIVVAGSRGTTDSETEFSLALMLSGQS
jgi:hypothetical protein